MFSTLNKAAGIIGLALIVIYSVIMMMSNGTTDWAWLVLVAGIALLVKPATSTISSGSQSDG